jgi:hypothetical protein
MKKWIYMLLKLCFLSLVILKSASGQTVSLDTNQLQAAVKNVNAYYTKAIGEQLPLYNGPEYYFYNPSEIRGSAYFMETTFTPGAVYYDGTAYTGVQLLYDIYKDQLVSVLRDQNTKYVLLRDRVQNFDLLDHHFININADTLMGNTVIKTGYYDELYHGKAQVLSRRYKTIQNYTSTTGALEAYNFFTATKEDFFIRKNNTYYQVASRGEILDVLRDRKKQIGQYIKTNNIKFNKDRGRALVSIATYYDRITN